MGNKMNFKYLWIYLIVVIFLFPSNCFSELDSKVWELYGLNSYYNKTNITKSSNIISVWMYTIITDDKRDRYIEGLKKIDLKESIKYQNYDHEIRLTDINCKNGQYRIK